MSATVPLIDRLMYLYSVAQYQAETATEGRYALNLSESEFATIADAGDRIIELEKQLKVVMHHQKLDEMDAAHWKKKYESDLVERLRAGTGFGKHWMDLHVEAADRIERLEAWIAYDAICPCCEQKRACVDECTFHKDDTSGHERMEAAREVLYG